MVAKAVEATRKRLLKAGLALQGDLKGCTEQEVLSVEDQFRIRLPPSYRDFLRVMGRSAGAFLAGSSYSFPTVLGIRDDAESLLRKCKSDFTLLPTAFVFFSHQGYNFEWFICHERADDPPVILFTEGESEPRKVADSFSAWLLGAVDDDIAAYRDLYGG